MNLSFQFVRSFSRATSRSRYVCSLCSRRLYSRNIVKENDIIMLKHRTGSSAPIITGPLRLGKVISPQHDKIKHEDIIGKDIRGVVLSKKKVLYRIHEPTLAEYTDNSQRLVTPIYSQDANLIVSLLDIHPTPAGSRSADEDKFEIFEAGTGHGALTLNLARAIHAANPAAPTIPGSLSGSKNSVVDGEPLDPEIQDDLALGGMDKQDQDDVETAYESWRLQRRAVIHTLDVSEPHSLHAQKVVKNFRKGLYYPHIDFHIGSIEGYLARRISEEGRPFLDHAILDLPATEEYLDIVSRALKPNGSLLIFCPSVTQIMECVKAVKESKLPLFIERSIEVGGAIGVGGREWDIRTVKPKVPMKEEQAEGSESVITDKEDLKMICRPKVGVRISGGGFVGHFRKIVDFSAPNVE